MEKSRASTNPHSRAPDAGGGTVPGRRALIVAGGPLGGRGNVAGRGVARRQDVYVSQGARD